MDKVKNIVLVHGAWGDGSHWSKVIQVLQEKRFNVTAVQNPLTSLEDDVDRTRRLLAMQDGPTLLVGHSYGGAVITEAATKSPNVTGLVYIAAFAPDTGESLNSIFSEQAPPSGAANIRPDNDGFLWIDPKKFHESFCQDLSKVEGDVLSAVQKPIAARCFDDKITAPAWKTLPTWYQVSENDNMIPPEAERRMAERMKAKTISLPASHASLASQPNEVANLIIEAVEALAGGLAAGQTS